MRELLEFYARAGISNYFGKRMSRGGWNSTGRQEADGLKKIQASFLKKHGYFSGRYQSGTMIWTSSYSDRKSSIGIGVWATPDNPLMRLNYTRTSNETGEKKDFMYDIPLTATPCRYGGKRWWFTCPMSRDGRYCGRRVAVLYLGGDLFACRHCYNLTYASRNASALYKGFVSAPDLDEQAAKVGRTHYRGRPTKKYRKLLRMEEKFNEGFLDAYLRISGKRRFP